MLRLTTTVTTKMAMAYRRWPSVIVASSSVLAVTASSLVAGSAVLGWYLANQQVPERLANYILENVTGRVTALLLIDAILLAAGMILHSAAAIVLQPKGRARVSMRLMPSRK